VEIPQLSQRSNVYPGFCSNLVPYRLEAHPDDGIKVFELGVANVDVV
jgi:hypothetical protein